MQLDPNYALSHINKMSSQISQNAQAKDKSKSYEPVSQLTSSYGGNSASRGEAAQSYDWMPKF